MVKKPHQSFFRPFFDVMWFFGKSTFIFVAGKVRNKKNREVKMRNKENVESKMRNKRNVEGRNGEIRKIEPPKSEK